MIRDYIPPAAYRHLRRLRRRFSGDYSSFAEAMRHCGGYNEAGLAGAIAARRPEFDAVHVDERTQQVLAALSVIPKRPIKVLDAGGGNGGYYFAISRFIAVEWTILETTEMVKANSGLRYCTEIPEEKFDVVLMSGFLQCVEKPFDMFGALSSRASHIIINRLPLISGRDRIAIQKEDIGSYPCWFFNEDHFLAHVQRTHRILMRWDVPQDRPMIGGQEIVYQGMSLVQD